MPEENQDQDWTAVAGRSLAYLALHQAGLREKDLATQGIFLENLGLSRRNAALILGTTAASLTELYRQARARKGRKRAKKGKKR